MPKSTTGTPTTSPNRRSSNAAAGSSPSSSPGRRGSSTVAASGGKKKAAKPAAQAPSAAATSSHAEPAASEAEALAAARHAAANRLQAAQRGRSDRRITESLRAEKRLLEDLPEYVPPRVTERRVRQVRDDLENALRGRSRGRVAELLGPVAAHDLRWNARNTTALPCAGAAIGLVAGLLGLGGGELIAPLLLIVGMLPQVGAATSACMVLFTSSSDVAHYLSEGVLAPDLGYVLAAATLGFTSALCGRLLALRLVRVLSHPSLIAFTLGGLLLGACGLLLAQVAEQAPDFSVAPIQCK